MLAQLKQKWGYAIKAFVFRFRELGVIDDAQARSLYKQISARRWNKDEPHRPGTESAVWLRKALQERFVGDGGLRRAAAAAGLHERYFQHWLDWSPSGTVPRTAPVATLLPREGLDASSVAAGRITRLPRRRYLDCRCAVELMVVDEAGSRGRSRDPRRAWGGPTSSADRPSECYQMSIATGSRIARTAAGMPGVATIIAASAGGICRRLLGSDLTRSAMASSPRRTLLSSSSAPW